MRMAKEATARVGSNYLERWGDALGDDQPSWRCALAIVLDYQLSGIPDPIGVLRRADRVQRLAPVARQRGMHHSVAELDLAISDGQGLEELGLFSKKLIASHDCYICVHGGLRFCAMDAVAAVAAGKDEQWFLRRHSFSERGAGLGKPWTAMATAVGFSSHRLGHGLLFLSRPASLSSLVAGPAMARWRGVKRGPTGAISITGMTDGA